jgi:methionine-rich copper-binding protein CopC
MVQSRTVSYLRLSVTRALVPGSAPESGKCCNQMGDITVPNTPFRQLKRYHPMKRSITTFVIGLVMLAITVIVAGAAENLLPVSPASSLSVDCEGNACAQVTLTFDEAKQQYKVQNNSNQLVRVEASNLAGGNRILVEAGKEAYLPMKSIVGSYRATYE